MSRIIAVVLIFLAVLTGIGIILPAISKAREEEEIRRCQNHLRQIASIGLFHTTMPGQPIPLEAKSYFPAGTVMNPELTPEQRLSWYLLTLSAIDQGSPEPGAAKKRKATPFIDLMKDIDINKAWDAEANQKLGRTRLVVALCPGQRLELGPDQPALTNYFGNGGIGLDTPTLTIEEAARNAGVFRYNTPTPLDVIRDGDGLSNTISIVESARDIGPWLRGGPATIRCLDPNQPLALGQGQYYSGCHRGRGNFAFADGHVSVMTDSTNPAFFRALLTIQGGEKEEDFDGK